MPAPPKPADPDYSVSYLPSKEKKKNKKQKTIKVPAHIVLSVCLPPD
jgi:hypothetical protein